MRVFFWLILFFGLFSIAAPVAGGELSASEVEKWISVLEPEQKERLANDSFLRERFVKHIKEVEALYQRALAEGLERDPLVRRKLELLKKETLARIWLERETEKRMRRFRLSEEDLLLYYRTHKEEFRDSKGQLIPFEKVKSLIEKKLRDEHRRTVVEEIVREVLEGSAEKDSK